MNDWTGEELRRAALAALGEFPDPRALEALQRGDLTIAPGVGEWEASSGHVSAHRVTLSLDAELLGTMRASHAAHDSLEAALARAVASRSGQALLGLELRWARRDTAAKQAKQAKQFAYRDSPPGALPPFAHAMSAYLIGLGQETIAHIVAAARFTHDASELRLALPQDDKARLFAIRGSLGLLASAARDLLGNQEITIKVEP